jgi:hypothetical protein
VATPRKTRRSPKTAPKPALQSKTVQLNIALFIVGAAALLQNVDWSSGATYATLMFVIGSLGNLYIRIWHTDTPIE